MESSALHDPFPRVAAAARVASNREIAPGVFELVVDRTIASGGISGADGAGGAGGLISGDSGERIPAPVAGQFFMLRARPSAVLLGRPISAYRADEASITFLILKKGAGSAELCALRPLDSLDLVGPIGNRFLLPGELASGERSRIAVIGGGIGVAPVAGFSLGLAEKSFDFYASFRSAPYGLEGVAHRAARLVVTTEDGSAGVKGMLPAVFDSASYDLVYACGPTPMLRYVQKACAEDSRNANVASGAGSKDSSPRQTSRPLCFLSLEEHMACGAGACLGCTVRTTGGNRRCCVDGPVFNAAEVIL